MLKHIKKYLEEYNDVPNDLKERVIDLLNKLRKQDLDNLQESINYVKNIKKKSIHFLFYMEPKATPRARLGKFGSFYVGNAGFNSKLFKEFLDTDTTIKNFITTPCKIKMDIFLPIRGMSLVNTILGELRLLYPVSKPDLDNTAKTYQDMIQSHILLDDSLVVDLHVRKFYSIKPRIDLKIVYLENYDSVYNKKKIESWKNYKERK